MTCALTRPRVLILTDGYVPVRELVERALATAGYLPCCATTASGALAQALLCRPTLALVDDGVERKNGGIIRALREQGMPVVGIAHRDHCEALRLAGARECIEKPFGKETLLEAVKRALEEAPHGT